MITAKNLVKYLGIIKFKFEVSRVWNLKGGEKFIKEVRSIAGDRDVVLTWDIANDVLSLYGYEESHHNGDHYDRIHSEVKWTPVTRFIVDQLIEQAAKDKAIAEVRAAERAEFDQAVRVKLENAANGHF